MHVLQCRQRHTQKNNQSLDGLHKAPTHNVFNRSWQTISIYHKNIKYLIENQNTGMQKVAPLITGFKKNFLGVLCPLAYRYYALLIDRG